MKPLDPALPRRVGPGLSAITLALVALIESVLLPSSVRAEAAAPGVPIPATCESGPPAYPDTVHLPQGCYISTVAYLVRFHAEFPAERGAPQTVMVRSLSGLHTIAMVTWRGEWWGRDGRFGVFALHRAVATRRPLERLCADAGFALDRIVSRQLKHGRDSAAFDPPGELPDAARLDAVSTAAKLVPQASRIFWVRSGRRELPFLFFRPAAGAIAVYDPASGTTQAECAATNDSSIVATVAARLGYKVAAVRPEPTLPPPELLASASEPAR